MPFFSRYCLAILRKKLKDKDFCPPPQGKNWTDRLKTMEEHGIAGGNYPGDGKHGIRKTIMDAYIIALQILDTPRLIKDETMIQQANLCLQYVIHACEKLFGWYGCMHNVHILQHLADQVNLNQATLTQLSAYDYESEYGLYKNFVPTGLHPLQQLKRRKLEQIEHEGFRHKYHNQFDIDAYVSRDQESRGVAYEVLKRGIEGEVVLYRKYTTSERILETLDIPNFEIKVDSGSLLSMWTFHMTGSNSILRRECKPGEFEGLVRAINGTPCILFPDKDVKYSMPLMHLDT